MNDNGLIVSGNQGFFRQREFQYTPEKSIYLETSENTGSNNFNAYYNEIISMRIEIPRHRKNLCPYFFKELNCVHPVHKLTNIIDLTKNLFDFTYLNLEVK
jgi:hypothetical protein